MSLSEKKVRPLILSALKNSMRSLLKELELESLAHLSDEQGDFESKKSSKSENELESNRKMDFKNDFHAFKHIIRNIHSKSEMLHSGQSQNMNLIDIIEIIEEKGIYNASWIEKYNLLEEINTQDTISQDEENSNYIFQAFEKGSINLRKEMHDLLVGYTKYIMHEKYNLNFEMVNERVDLRSFHPMYINGELLIEVKSNRVNKYSPNRDDIYKLYEILRESDERVGSEISQIYLVAYYSFNNAQFGTVQFKFKQLLKQLDISESYQNRISLIPATIIDPNTIIESLQNQMNLISTMLFDYNFLSSKIEKNNHIILPKVFRTNGLMINVEIVPQNTPYWRFGIVLSNEEEFRITDDESCFRNTKQIQVCIGNYSQEKWGNPNQISIASYDGSEFLGVKKSNSNYRRTNVNMNIRLFRNNMTLEVASEKVNLGTMNFSNDKVYIHFMGWCDNREFDLSTKFVVSKIKD